jgi:hypothetical protein
MSDFEIATYKKAVLQGFWPEKLQSQFQNHARERIVD